jgi:hypothetical protein
MAATYYASVTDVSAALTHLDILRSVRRVRDDGSVRVLRKRTSDPWDDELVRYILLMVADIRVNTFEILRLLRDDEEEEMES